MPTEPPRLPAGRPPWDPLNGLRVGALAGGLVGGALTFLTDSGLPWWIFACAVAGGGIGYWIEKRKARPEPPPRSVE